MSGLLAGLLSKLAGLGTAAKAALAAATAAVTMTVAGGAAGVLPIAGGSAGTTASVQAPAPATATAGVAASATPSSIAATIVQATAGASTTPTTAHAAAGVTTPASTTAAAAVATPPAPSVQTPTLPTLPALPACIKDLIPAKGTTPDPATLIPKLVACVQSLVATHLSLTDIQGVLGSANLPANVTTCLSSVFSSLPGLTTGSASGLSQVLAACVPTGSLPSFGSIPLPGAFSGAGPTLSHKSGR